MNDEDIYFMYSEQFRTIDDNLDDLMNRAENFAQASRINDSWKQANLNYTRARNKLFAAHEAQIKDLVKDFENAQAAIKKSLADLKKQATTIGQVSQIISQGVGVGTKLEKAV